MPWLAIFVLLNVKKRAILFENNGKYDVMWENKQMYIIDFLNI